MQLIALIIFTYAQVWTTLQLPTYMADIVNQGIIGQEMDKVYHYGILMLVVTFGGAVASVIVGYLASKIATGFTRDVRVALFTKVESFSANEFNKFSTASLITRSTNDLQQVQQALTMLLRMMLMAPIMAVGALQNALGMAPDLTWIIALAIAVMIVIIPVLFYIGMPKFRALQQMIDRLNLVTRENLTGLRVVRAFNNQDIEQSKFDKANIDLTKLNLFTNRLMITMQPIMTLVMSLSTVAIVWFGAQLVFNSGLEIGNMLAFMQYAIQVIMSFLMLSIMFIIVPRAVVSARRVGEVIASESSIVDPETPKKFPSNLTGRVEFRSVTFSYPGAAQPVLNDINFVAEPGQTTALIGSTGSGKTTLVHLIPRFYDVTSGQILIDDIDIRDVTQADLRSNIGFVPQKASLFSGDISSNIRYGNHHISDSDINKALDAAQATEFINKLQKGLNHEVSQGGSNLSGGQKQRLSIARALAADSKIYVFDDSFSALDFKTDSLIRKALKSSTKGKTVIMVGQRIGSIADADKIIVVGDDGKIAGVGTHDELLKTNEVYQDIARSQLSDSELKSLSKPSKKPSKRGDKHG